MYTAKTTKIELQQIIQRLSSENAALRERISQLEGDIERTSTAWMRGPRPAQPAPAPRDTSFAARAETLRKVGAHLATVLGRPATRGEVMDEVQRLASL